MIVKKKANLKDLRSAKNDYVPDWEISQMMPEDKQKEKENRKKSKENNDLLKKFKTDLQFFDIIIYNFIIDCIWG